MCTDTFSPLTAAGWGAEGEMPLSIKPKDGCRWDLVSLGGDSGCVRRSDAPTDDTRRWRR
jgi:hypothetical protein